MYNGFVWSKLSLQQRYNYGVFIIISTLSAVILWLSNENAKNQRRFDAIRNKEISETRKKDSISILYWKNRADVAETKLFNYLDNKEKEYKKVIDEANQLKLIINAKK